MSCKDRKPRILVVDDTLQNVELLEAHLVSAGYEVTSAYDGAEALKEITRKHPDIILLDVMMPKMNGYEVCRRLKKDKDTQFIPIIMITALSEMEDKVEGLEAGADDFMNKPIRKIELLTRVKSLIRIKNLHDQLEQSYQEMESRNEILDAILSRYVSREIVDQIIENPQKHLHLGGEDKVITTLFADIRGFTNFARKNTAQKVVSILNDCFSEMVKTVFRHKGTFDKYIGDCIMAFFGAPIGYEDDVSRALQTAVELQGVFKKVKERWNDKDFNQLGLGIGINTGKVVVGNIGSEKMMDYTVVGDNVNIARRLQQYAPKGAIVMSGSTYCEVKDKVVAERLPSLSLKGSKKKIFAYRLERLL
ncbi:MAG: adenylate/guanylate cyclase domain-containing protein [Thermodesulfobacteriota bacterium]|nr:adenylate/guanylate cyclase domain-containing protein [Thermodesulfobacteriota bacterium]